MSSTSKIWDYVTEVLRLLSPSSWLPSAVLVGETALLLAMRSSGSADIAHATVKVARNELLLILFLVLATMMTEALAVPIMLIFMGHVSSRNGLVLRLVYRRIRRHQRKVDRMRAEYQDLETRAWAEARSALAAAGVPEKQLDIIEQRRRGAVPSDGEASDVEVSEALEIRWPEYAATPTQYRLTALLALLDEYPARHRILPTMLGNVLRAREERLFFGAGELEGYVMRHYGKLSPLLQNEHHLHRTRMSLYCWLTLVFGLLALLNPLLLAGIAQLWMIVASSAIHTVMAWISYGAAVDSAQGYGVVLDEIDQLVRAETPAASD